jgi:Tfp pilus assembly protein PilE
LAVVLIIGILAAIAIPRYTTYVNRIRISEAVSNLDQIFKQMLTFYDQNDSYIKSDGSLVSLDDLPVVFPQKTPDWECAINYYGTRKDTIEATASLTRHNGSKYTGSAYYVIPSYIIKGRTLMFRYCAGNKCADGRVACIQPYGTGCLF